MIDECGAEHTRPGGAVAVKWWSINNEGEHARSPGPAIRLYDAIVAGIKRFEHGAEHPMRFVGVNQNTGGSASVTAGWITTFMNRSLHAAGTEMPAMVAFHGYFHGPGNSHSHSHTRSVSQAAAPRRSPINHPEAAPSPPLCVDNCRMVEYEENTHYIGRYYRPANASAESAAACEAVCLADRSCAGTTFSKRPTNPCMLYSTLTRAITKEGRIPTVGAVKCAAGSTVAATCGHFLPSPSPPPPPPAPEVCDSWGTGPTGPAAFETVFGQVDAFVNSTIATMVKLRVSHFLARFPPLELFEAGCGWAYAGTGCLLPSPVCA